ncbi:MAG: hypothetical protein IPP19_12545 [Verrucomicrobia bacterium]|nr:hypothetical protein [Verrucomicrobiota bacterium]
MSDTVTKPSREKLSTTPSWIMVGFIIGAMFAYGVQREVARRNQLTPPPPPAPAPVKVEPQKSAAAIKDRASLAAIENVFTQYESQAVWRHDITEVALWNAETNKFSEFFEVMRSGEYYYYRTLPHLTRPVIRHNVNPDLPLRFTEPEDVQLKRLKETSSVWLPPSTEP